jgi:hypothetical protein
MKLGGFTTLGQSKTTLCEEVRQTVSRAATQLVLTGEMEQDKRGRLTFWRVTSSKQKLDGS